MPRLWLLLTVVLAACAAPGALPRCPPSGGDVAFVIDHGWHTDIAVPARELSGPAGVFRTRFPGARAFVFGFGKRTFFTARVESWREYLLGPFPGPAAILVTALAVPPDAAYPPAAVVRLALPAGGAAALSEFLGRQFARDGAGGPKLIAPGFYPGSLFYAATGTYGLDNTCNTWTAHALRAAGLPVSPAGVAFAGQVMMRARAAARCALPGGH